MSFTVNFHTDKNTVARVNDLDGADTPGLVSVNIGTSGDHVTILGSLTQVQDAIDDAAAQLATLSKARGDRFERSLAREHAVPCLARCGRSTFNHSALCDECAEHQSERVSA